MIQSSTYRKIKDYFIPSSISKNIETEVLEKEENIVQKIHNEFNTASDNLLEEANKILSQETDKEYEKGKRLSAIGFNNTEQAKIASDIDKKRENYKKKMDLVLYYKKKLPDYKFITEDQITNICKKYNLVFGDSKDYIGYIPEKNIEDIEKYYQNPNALEYYAWTFGFSTSYHECTKEEYKRNQNNINYYKFKKLKIVAPQKDFNLQNKKILDFRIVPLDPVVLAQVYGGYIVITAWGLEAEDKNLK